MPELHRKYKHLLLTFGLLCAAILHAQQNSPLYWIAFTDKAGTAYSTDRPEEFLSPRAISRRVKQNIPITEEDLPVSRQYLQALNALDVPVLHTSRWLNGAIISCEEENVLAALAKLEFVESGPTIIKPALDLKSSKADQKLEFSMNGEETVYGASAYQLEMLNTRTLHEENFTGEGMLIAVLDAGFSGANQVESLQHIWNSGSVLAMHDVVKDGRPFFGSHGHGTVVWSIIGGLGEGYLYGSAPKANFALIRTEDAYSEYLVEEYYWAVGAEYADSLGADIINSSLGYSIFDDPSQNHRYTDLDGTSTPISRAAEIVSNKGILVVTSAGNSGGPPWYKITAPADAPTVVAVGAVDSAEVITDFSGRGPSADGRIKPDVSAMGFKTVAQHPAGYYYYCTGTSCSSPLIAGIAACLWQKYPDATQKDIREAILKSSSKYYYPDTIYGYGIPDLVLADALLTEDTYSGNKPIRLSTFPNPATDRLVVEIRKSSGLEQADFTLRLFTIDGKKVWEQEIRIEGDHMLIDFTEFANLRSGVYSLSINFDEDFISVPVIKIPGGNGP